MLKESKYYLSKTNLAIYPDCIKLDKIDDIKHLFAESARDASKEFGDVMVQKSLEYLKEVIK